MQHFHQHKGGKSSGQRFRNNQSFAATKALQEQKLCKKTV
jgi:hypothetical protein